MFRKNIRFVCGWLEKCNSFQIKGIEKIIDTRKYKSITLNVFVNL